MNHPTIKLRTLTVARLWLVGVVLAMIAGFFVVRQASNLWDEQLGSTSVNHSTETANIHTGSGFLGFAVFIAGLMLFGLAAYCFFTAHGKYGQHNVEVAREKRAFRRALDW